MSFLNPHQLQQHLVNQAEHRRAGADARPDREARDQRNPGILAQSTRRETEDRSTSYALGRRPVGSVGRGWSMS
jgi:hypothetical protein